MSDLISRQDAIDAMERWLYDGEDNRTVREVVYELPSAQPEIIRCKDCKWWRREDVFKDGSSMIVCKKGRSVDPEGYCHHAERRTDDKTNKSSSC